MAECEHRATEEVAWDVYRCLDCGLFSTPSQREWHEVHVDGDQPPSQTPVE